MMNFPTPLFQRGKGIVQLGDHAGKYQLLFL